MGLLRPTTITLLGVSLLLACGRPDAEPWVPMEVEYDDDDVASPWPVCDGAPGPQEVVLCEDDEDYTPLDETTTYGIARRHQGAITFMAPIWFGGLEGGKQLQELSFLFVDSEGEVQGERITAGDVLPCLEDGTVAEPRLEIFFYPGVEVETYIGMEGTLTVEADMGLGHVLSDQVEAVLVHDEE